MRLFSSAKKHDFTSHMEYENNPRSIKYHVKQYLHEQQSWFDGKRVIDFPAGNGITSRILQEIGADPVALDLFPEYFQLENITCQRANIAEKLPLTDGRADALICQEGIEHFADQLHAIREFSRVLKKGGRLVITTPNYSNLRAKMSYLLSESERFNSIMPPNELDSIWMSESSITDEIYYGHIFLIGIQKLRVYARLAGFRIRHIRFVRLKSTSLLLFPLFYPFIWLSNWLNYRKNLRKNRNFDKSTKKKVYGELFRLATNPKILVDGHLFVEFEKEMETHEVAGSLRSIHKEFGTT